MYGAAKRWFPFLDNPEKNIGRFVRLCRIDRVARAQVAIGTSEDILRENESQAQSGANALHWQPRRDVKRDANSPRRKVEVDLEVENALQTKTISESITEPTDKPAIIPPTGTSEPATDMEANMEGEKEN